ncbi:helix-turn-helix transcriptional regulator [Vallitalea okinawensis]|uniref:helix-turn-helix transcriptional regulator n=1 Tax=Vallitalea okinawensis TaxID=2078660 RepID=UPI001478EB95|nr:helix-turn-helix domain-containing protein [Vallitalea okinawensis]
MDIRQFSPYIRVAMDSSINQPWQLKERVIFDYELQFIKEGQVEITIEDKVYHGQPGDLFFYQPKQHHTMKIIGDEPLRQPHLHFDFIQQSDSDEVKINFRPLEELERLELCYFRENISNSFGIEMPSYIHLKDPQFFEKILFEMIAVYREQPPFYECELKGLFIKMWTYLCREVYLQKEMDLRINMQRLEEVKTYILCHSEDNITLDQLAQTVGLSPYYLIRLFKKAYGLSPLQYHQQERIRRAKEMLLYSNHNVSEVAEILGYSSLHSFSRAFKKVEGISPSMYAKK